MFRVQYNVEYLDKIDVGLWRRVYVLDNRANLIRQMNNFHGAMAIYAGLKLNPVSRLSTVLWDVRFLVGWW